MSDQGAGNIPVTGDEHVLLQNDEGAWIGEATTQQIANLAAGGLGAARVLAFPFTFDTPDLLTGAALFTPTVDDVLLDAWVEVVEAWDGTTPLCDFGEFFFANGWFSNLGALPIDVTAADEAGSLGQDVLSQANRSEPSSLSLARAFAFHRRAGAPLLVMAEIGGNIPVFGATTSLLVRDELFASGGNWPTTTTTTSPLTVSAGGTLRPLLFIPTYDLGELAFLTAANGGAGMSMEFTVSKVDGSEKLTVFWNANSADDDIPLDSESTFAPDMTGDDWTITEQIGTDLSIDTNTTTGDCIRSTAGGQFIASWCIVLGGSIFYTGGGFTLRAVPGKFVTDDPIKVCVSQDGRNDGADPGSTQGQAILYLVLATPA